MGAAVVTIWGHLRLKFYDIDEGPPPLPPFPPPETAQCDPREPSSLSAFFRPSWLLLKGFL